MAAYDNAEMPRAPTSYGPPLVDFGAGIASLPDSYYQGKEMKRDYDIKRALQSGLPIDPKSGGPDYTAAANELFKKGGLEQGLQLANTGAQMEASKNFSGMMSGQPQQQPQQQPRPTAPVFAPPPDQSRPQVASAAQGNNGGDTVRSVMTEAFGGRDVSAAIPRLAQSIGVEADAPLSPQQVAQLKQRLAPGQERMQPQQAPQAAPQPQPQQAQPQQASTIPPALAGLIPANWPGTVQSFRDRLAAGATSPLLPPAAQKVAQERLKALDTAIAADAARTGEQKNAVDPNVESMKLREEQNKDQVTRYGKRYDAIAKQGEEAAKELPQLEVAAQVLQEGAYTGPGEGLVKNYKRLVSVFGGDPNVALPQDAFHKLIQNQVLAQIRGMAGTGPVRVAEMKIIGQAVANPDNSLSANRMIVDVGRRLMQRDAAVHQMAINYKGGRLDSGFDQQVKQYDEKNPMFTKQELADPRMIAPLIFKSPEAMKAAKLPPGTPFKTPDGGIAYAP